MAAIKKLYLDESTADVHFTFESIDGQPELVPGHKLLLSANSDVFQAMFNGSWKEHDKCEIVDASLAAFKEFLQFFYCDEIEVTAENVDVVMGLGQKYLVKECSNVCAQFLTDRLSNENVCSAYRLSLAIGREELKKICEVSICISAKDVFQSKGFLECDRSTLGNILKLDSLSCSEVEVFNASMDWVKTVSKATHLDKDTVCKHLGDDFHSIRFSAMTPDELNGIFSSHANLFIPEVRSKVVERIQSNDTEIVKRPRECVWDKADVIKCIRKISYADESEPYQIETDECTTFTSNKPLLLRAVVCGGIMEWRKFKYVESIEEDIDGEITICERRGAFKYESSNIIYEDKITMSELIRLTKPIIIKPGFSYKICVATESSDCYPYCTDYLIDSNDVKIKDKQIVVKFVSKGNMKRGGNGGLIYGLHFNEI